MTDEDRFIEIVSIEKIKDNLTGKEYNGFIDSELLIMMNHVDSANKSYRKENNDLRIVIDLLRDVVAGFKAHRKLKEDDWL